MVIDSLSLMPSIEPNLYLTQNMPLVGVNGIIADMLVMVNSISMISAI